MKINRDLFRMALAERWLLGAAILSGWLSGVFILAQSYFLANVIDQAFLKKSEPVQLVPDLLVIVLLIVMRFTFSYLSRKASSNLAVRIKSAIRDRFLRLLIIEEPMFTIQNARGDLLTTLVQRLDSIDDFFVSYLPQLAVAALIPLTILIVVFPLDVLSFFVFLVTAPLIPLFMILIGKWAELVIQKQWKYFSRLSQYYLDLLKGLPILKIFSQTGKRHESIYRMTDDFRHHSMQVLRVAFLSSLSLELLATLSTAVVAVEIGLRLLFYKIEFLQAFFILLLAPEFYFPLRVLATHYHAGQNSAEAAEKIFGLLQSIPSGRNQENVVRDTPLPVTGARLKISIEKISYGYRGAQSFALQDISMDFFEGKQAAIVGPNGAGKSTLFQLLLGLDYPSQGKMFLQESELLDSRSLASTASFAVLHQHPYFFAGTVWQNVFPPVDCSHDDVLAVLADLFLLEEIPGKDPLQWDIGDGGRKLSSGQRQRLAIARMLLQPSRFLLMDEPGSQLNAELEEKIWTRLKERYSHKGWLVITHRTALLRWIETVFIMRNGRIETTVSSKNFSDLFLAGAL